MPSPMQEHFHTLFNNFFYILIEFLVSNIKISRQSFKASEDPKMEFHEAFCDLVVSSFIFLIPL